MENINLDYMLKLTEKTLLATMKDEGINTDNLEIRRLIKESAFEVLQTMLEEEDNE